MSDTKGEVKAWCAGTKDNPVCVFVRKSFTGKNFNPTTGLLEILQEGRGGDNIAYLQFEQPITAHHIGKYFRQDFPDSKHFPGQLTNKWMRPHLPNGTVVHTHQNYTHFIYYNSSDGANIFSSITNSDISENKTKIKVPEYHDLDFGPYPSTGVCGVTAKVLGKKINIWKSVLVATIAGIATGAVGYVGLHTRSHIMRRLKLMNTLGIQGTKMLGKYRKVVAADNKQKRQDSEDFHADLDELQADYDMTRRATKDMKRLSDRQYSDMPATATLSGLKSTAFQVDEEEEDEEEEEEEDDWGAQPKERKAKMQRQAKRVQWGARGVRGAKGSAFTFG